MIALIAALGIQTSQVVEWLDTSASVVSIQAVVKLPDLAPRQHNMIKLIAATLGKDTKTFSANQIAEIASRTGSRLRIAVMDDHIRVGMEVVPADLATGVSMVGSVLKESVLKNEFMQSAADDLLFRRFPYWRAALDQRSFEIPIYSDRDMADLIATVFRPENVTLGVGGRLTPGLATRKWEDIVATWIVVKAPSLISEFAAVKEPTLTGKLAVFEFRGETILATDAAFAARLLALTALGTGKSSALFRIAREELGMSYRQEAVLSPVSAGFLPRLVVATSDYEELGVKADKLKMRLLEEIAKWTNGDRKRAIGMAESFLTRGGELSPLYFAPGRALTRDLSDEVFLQAYWYMKTKTRWNPHQLVGKMGFVELADLKEFASQLLSTAKLRVYRPR